MKGIIMSGDHPKKILDGTKTMTRRVVKKHIPDGVTFHLNRFDRSKWWYEYADRRPTIKCPYGQVGDRLWVRETHYRWGHWAKNGFSKTGKQKWTFKAESNELYYSDDPPCAVQHNRFRGTAWYKRPSIHMPRWASRISLEITEVRVERVQEITFEDCLREGIMALDPDVIAKFGKDWQPPIANGKEPVDELADDLDSEIRHIWMKLWDSLNAKGGYGWTVNPGVWVIGFKRA